MSKSGYAPNGASDLASAAVVIVVYFAFMLTIGFAPRIFTAPIHADSVVSTGLVCAIAMTAFVLVFCAWYTHRRNSREPT